MDVFERIQVLIKSIGWLPAIIAFIITFYKSSQKKIESYEEDYFDKVLLPYVEKYRKDKNINSIEFFNDKNSIINCYIPSYIFYTIDKKDSIILHKILMNDYWENYNSSLNNINKKLEKFSSSVDFAQIFFYIFMMIYFFLLAILSAIIGILELAITLNINSDIKIIFIIAVISIMLSFGIRHIAKRSIKNIKDNYTMKSEDIEKLIKVKENEYNKNHTKYYIN
ncbi:TPA: hypothetical protein ACG3O0_003534 [Clostridioides difficile]